VVAVKHRVAPDRRFGLGLRLSAQAAETLAEPAQLAACREFLDRHGLYVFTINGFPHGAFHGTPVKEAVYLPDWMDEARLTYTDRLATILAALLPDQDGLVGSISTVPGAFKPSVRSDRDVARIAELLIRQVATLHALYERSGKVIALALEPEPCCYLETVAETVTFFERHLFSTAAVERLSQLTGLQRSSAEAFLRSRLGVCFDACHMAVEYEDPIRAVRTFQAAGISIGKIQISAGLKVAFSGSRRDTIHALRPFAESVYLHQVVDRHGGSLVRYIDLPDALKASEREEHPAEWRIHFHVPLFLEHLGPFVNTQDDLRTLLDLLKEEPVSPHLEVETYTWEVLPEEFRREDIVTAVTRELQWVMQRLSSR
jgi:sugar phosphate isomerase/epimerase